MKVLPLGGKGPRTEERERSVFLVVLYNRSGAHQRLADPQQLV